MKRVVLLVLAYGPTAALVAAALFQPDPWRTIVIGLALVHAELATWRLERRYERRGVVTVNNVSFNQRRTPRTEPGDWST